MKQIFITSKILQKCHNFEGGEVLPYVTITSGGLGYTELASILGKFKHKLVFLNSRRILQR